MELHLGDKKIGECQSVIIPTIEEIDEIVSENILLNTLASIGNVNGVFINGGLPVGMCTGWDKYQRYISIQMRKNEFYKNNILWTKIVKKLRKK